MGTFVGQVSRIWSSGVLLHTDVRTPAVPTLSFDFRIEVARSLFAELERCFQVTIFVNYIVWSPMDSEIPPVVADSKLGVLVDPTVYFPGF